MHEIAVVGAGPCGASAALALEEAGVDYILLDKSSFPRNKPCGGVLPFRVLEEFDLGREVFERPLRGYRIYSLSGRKVESRFPRKGAVVDRTKFDSQLLSRLDNKPIKARARGVEIIKDGVEVLCEERVRAKLAIACDGASSALRSSLGLDYPSLAPALQYVFSLKNSEIDKRIGDWFEVYYHFARGYGWLSPLKGRLRAGVGGLGRGFNRGLLDSFLLSPPVRDKLGGAQYLGYEAHTIPMAGPLETPVKHRVLLAGDAGGFVYPGTGEGIYYAMKSGRAAAKVAVLALESGKIDDSFLKREYLKQLDSWGLLSLGEVNFLDSVLASPESAESYIARLARMQR